MQFFIRIDRVVTLCDEMFIKNGKFVFEQRFEPSFPIANAVEAFQRNRDRYFEHMKVKLDGKYGLHPPFMALEELKKLKESRDIITYINR